MESFDVLHLTSSCMNEMRQNIIRVITAHKLQRKSALTITVTGFKISGNTSEGDEQLLTMRTEKLCCHIYVYTTTTTVSSICLPA